MKRCSRCEHEKVGSEFWKNASAKDGLQAHCKTCQVEHMREWRAKNIPHLRAYDKQRYKDFPHIRRCKKNSGLKKRYGITMDEKDALLVGQNGRCGICQNEFRVEKEIHVDHCHSTGVVRGLLCNSCNNGLGRFKDNEQYLTNAMLYIREHRIGNSSPSNSGGNRRVEAAVR